ncbi:MAG: glycosyltransferase family 2 protein [Candidatus Margulisiibacteriota bacterium]
MPNINTATLTLSPRLKCWAYQRVNRNRLLNLTLDIFGRLARGITCAYVPGRSRSIHEIFFNVNEAARLEIKEDGVYHGENIVSGNTFLAEAFLEKGITAIDTTPGFTPKDLINLNKMGVPLYTDKLCEVTDKEKASKLLELVRDKNLMLQLRTYGFAGIFSSVSYFLYRAVTLAYLNGSVLDFVFSSLLVSGIAFDAFLVLKNQQHLISGQKYIPPAASEESKTKVSGENGPRATILVPALNEPLEVMKKTLLAAGRQGYANNEVVLLLDDAPGSESIPTVYNMVGEVNEQLLSEGKSARVKIFERKKYNNVLNQSRNKADNLNGFLVYAMGKQVFECQDQKGTLVLLTKEELDQKPKAYRVLRKMEFNPAEHVVIIDADYKLVPEFLTETIAILEERPDTAMVQTPQNLIPEGESEIEKISATGINANWQFLRRGNARDGSLFWGGTNCTIRRQALESIKQIENDGKIEFVPTKNITEDLYSSLLLLRQGWKLSFIPKPMAEGLPINNLSDHFSTFWRYVEGTTEATIEQVLPYMIKHPKYAFSKQGLEFFSHALQGFMGYPIMFFAAAPLISSFGVVFPPLHAVPFTTLLFLSLWINSRSAWLAFRRLNGRPFDNVKCSLLYIMHSPTYIHATLTAIKNRILGKRAQFLRTPKDGERSAVPLKYLLPLIGIPVLNALSFGISFSQYLDGNDGKIHPAAWSLFNAAAITYGLIYFNGLKNTWRDLKFGVKNIFKRS